MCDGCDYRELMRSAGVRPTARRLAVLSIIGAAGRPVTARQILERAGIEIAIDRVTVYRALQGLYEAGLIERVKAGDRSWAYHLTVSPSHPRHPHFYCTACGDLTCLDAASAKLDINRLQEIFPAQVVHLEIRLEGVCPDCLAQAAERKS